MHKYQAEITLTMNKRHGGHFMRERLVKANTIKYGYRY